MTLTIHITRSTWLFLLNNNFLKWDWHMPAMPGTARIGKRTYTYLRGRGWARALPRTSLYREITDYRW